MTENPTGEEIGAIREKNPRRPEERPILPLFEGQSDEFRHGRCDAKAQTQELSLKDAPSLIERVWPARRFGRDEAGVRRARCADTDSSWLLLEGPETPRLCTGLRPWRIASGYG